MGNECFMSFVDVAQHKAYRYMNFAGAFPMNVTTEV